MLHYRRAGTGPTLVLQHGFLGGGAYWRPQIDALSPMFDVIAPDLAGFAGSARERIETSIEGHARAVVDLLDALEIERCHFVGHSMGGMVAQQIALEHPDRISRLVLYGTASSGNVPERFESLDRSIRRIEEDGITACAERIVGTWLVDGDRSPYYPLCLQAGREASEEAAIAALRALAQWDVTQRLGEIALPTLVLCGDSDRSVGLQETLSLRRAIGNSALCIAPRCAHNVHLDAPELFNDVVRAFLSRSDPTA